jgi:hypothetical protein
MVKIAILSKIRSDVKTGKLIDKILQKYEYTTFAIKDGELIMINNRKE